MSLNKFMVYGIVTLSMLFWSMTYVWYKVVFVELMPITVMTFRLVFSAAFLLGFSKFTKRLAIPNKTDFLWLLLLSFFQPFLYFLAESYGVSMVSSTLSAVIISTIPVFTPLVAYLFFGDRITLFNFFGLVLSFLGVLIVILGKDFHFEGSVTGILILFGAVASALAYAVIIVKLAGKYNSFTIISWQNLFGTLYFLPLFFIVDWEAFTQANFTPKIILNLFYLSFFGSSLAYVLFTYSIKHMGITRASMFTNVIPIFTAAFAFIILNERLEWIQIIGIFVVLSGLYMAQKKPLLSKQPQ